MDCLQSTIVNFKTEYLTLVVDTLPIIVGHLTTSGIIALASTSVKYREIIKLDWVRSNYEKNHNDDLLDWLLYRVWLDRITNKNLTRKSIRKLYNDLASLTKSNLIIFDLPPTESRLLKNIDYYWFFEELKAPKLRTLDYKMVSIINDVVPDVHKMITIETGTPYYLYYYYFNEMVMFEVYAFCSGVNNRYIAKISYERLLEIFPGYTDPTLLLLKFLRKDTEQFEKMLGGTYERRLANWKKYTEQFEKMLEGTYERRLANWKKYTVKQLWNFYKFISKTDKKYRVISPCLSIEEIDDIIKNKDVIDIIMNCEDKYIDDVINLYNKHSLDFSEGALYDRKTINAWINFMMRPHEVCWERYDKGCYIIINGTKRLSIDLNGDVYKYRQKRAGLMCNYKNEYSKFIELLKSYK